MKTTLHRGATLGIGRMGQILVVAHGKAPPSPEDWDEVCAIIGELHREMRGQVVLSLGGVPNAAQRKAAIGMLPEGYVAPPVAALTDDVFARGIITAMNWFLNDSHRALGTRDAAGVASHLGIDAEEASALVDLAHALAPRTSTD